MKRLINNTLIALTTFFIMLHSVFIKFMFFIRGAKRKTKKIFVSPPMRSLIPNDYQWTLAYPPDESETKNTKLRSWTIMEHHCAVQSWRMNGHFNEELYKHFLLLRYETIGSTIK